MFLLQVYKYSKWLFVCMVLFIAGQLFVNYKWGLVVSPFYNYGMFSDTFRVSESYHVLQVEQNGKLLRGQDFSPQQWDNILLPVQYFYGIDSSNQLFYTEVRRLLCQLHISAKEQDFIQHCSPAQFKNWYGKYLQQVTGRQADQLQLYYRLFRFGPRLQSTNTTAYLQ